MQMRQVFVGAAVLAAVSFVFSGQSGFFPGFPGNLVTNLWVPGQPGFDYYKLSLQWQPSTCSPLLPPRQCVKPAIEMFTIHGLWPQRVGDVGVSPYRDDTTCTTTVPTPESALPNTLRSLINRLANNWPNLLGINMLFWQMEWGRHGMCSDYPDNPFTYFQSALDLHQTFDNLQTVLAITPGTWYTAGEILEKVKTNFNVYPQIACNKTGTTVQLWEIRFCYKRTTPPTTLQDCPCRLAGCEYLTKILFPKAVKLSEL